jgi:hypothetical protein
MNQAEEFERNEVTPADGYGHESHRNGTGRRDIGGLDPRPLQTAREPIGRSFGAPLPVGNGGKSPVPLGHEEGQHVRAGATPPGRSLTPRADSDPGAGMQWAMSALKQAMPFMQRLLPLIDGNIATAVSNLISSRPAPPPAPRVDLQPIETGLTELQGQQRDLRTQILEHNSSLKRVEDQLEMVREATDRNTLEQQELIEDLKAMGSRVNLFALTLLALLVLSLLINLFLFLHIQRVLP